MTLPLIAYRILAEPALAVLAAAAALDNASQKLFGNTRSDKTLWPRRWRPADRLRLDAPANAGEEARETLWLHAASLGEAKGLWTFAESLRAAPVDEPDNALPPRFLITTNTVEALDFLRQRIAARPDAATWHARLAPPDHPRRIRAFLRGHRARALVLFEMELWPHTLFEMRRAGLPVIWVSARFTGKAARRYRLFPRSFRAVLETIAWTQAQTAEEAEALRRCGCPADRIETGADLRGLYYLPALETAARAAPREAAEPPTPRRGIAWVSMHADELPAIRPALEASPRDVPVFVFPRALDEVRAFEKTLAPLGFTLQSRTTLDAARGAEQPVRVIVDAFGQVGDALRRCETAVIGGSFAPRGGHNLWEPLCAGVEIVTGPHHESQRYLATRLRHAGLLILARNSSELKKLATLASNPAESRMRFIDEERMFLRRCRDIAQRMIFSLLAKKVTAKSTYAR